MSSAEPPLSTAEEKPAGPLHGLRVLDLSRVLAGPWASQILGDLGAEVFKVEQPGKGDDTRAWGPPFVQGPDGAADSAYYLCCNRNKHGLAIDLARPEGAALIRSLANTCDVVIENFRVGALARYGLDYASLAAGHGSLIYCSITGFGQTGPDKERGGYDFLIQGMSGLMSVTGLPDGEPGAGPMKVGIPISDLSAGLYATISILAALNHRTRTGEGQHIDCALFDTQVSLLANQASNYLNGGPVPRRLGNEHPNVVPYQEFATSDANVLVAIGNDRQFRELCRVLGRPDLAADERFIASAGRSTHRKALQAQLIPVLRAWSSSDLLLALNAAHLPAGRVNRIDEALAEPQTAARGLIRELQREDGTKFRVLAYPHRFSKTPASYRKAPPRIGEDTLAVLASTLRLDVNELERLRQAGVIADAGVGVAPD